MASSGGTAMSLYLFIIFVLAMLLIGFAITKRDNVRASFSFRPFGFTLEARNSEDRKEGDEFSGKIDN